MVIELHCVFFTSENLLLGQLATAVQCIQLQQQCKPLEWGVMGVYYLRYQKFPSWHPHTVVYPPYCIPDGCG